MHISFLPIIVEAAHPTFHIDITHSLTSYRSLIQQYISCVPYYHTQFISTNQNQLILQSNKYSTGIYAVYEYLGYNLLSS